MGCDIADPSPKEMLHKCAKALDENDASAFIACFDMKACASVQIQTMTRENDALNTLDFLGRNLGLGGMEDLIGNVFDMENSLQQNFVKKSSTGELAKECSRKEKTGCPWVPESLRKAEVKTHGDNQAVARVKAPTGITTWLALGKKDKGWHIVGWAALESDAKRYAEDYILGKQTPPPAPQEKKSKKKDKSGEPLTI